MRIGLPSLVMFAVLYAVVTAPADVLAQTNTPPSIHVTGGNPLRVSPSRYVKIPTVTTVRVWFTDPDAGDSHTVDVDWGDGTVHTNVPFVWDATENAYRATDSYQYTVPGYYDAIRATITDGAGATAEAAREYIIVHDPNEERVASGGGAFESGPATCITPTPPCAPNGAGKATFNFRTTYVGSKFPNHPKGKIKFVLRTADVHAISVPEGMDTMIISGPYVRIRAGVELNGDYAYTMHFTAFDADMTADPSDEDGIRVQIWTNNGPEDGDLVYDSEVGSPTFSDDVSALDRGRISIK